MIGYFTPLFPTIPRDFGLIQLGRDFPPIETRFYPLIIGASYFVELEVSGSIIIYFLFLTFQLGMFRRFGFETGPLRADTSDFENWQGLGALFVLIPWGLWTARGHLRDVVRKAFTKDPTIGDTQEMLSYRSAVFGLILSALFICAWCVASGMTVYVAFVFVALSLSSGLESRRSASKRD